MEIAGIIVLTFVVLDLASYHWGALHLWEEGALEMWWAALTGRR